MDWIERLNAALEYIEDNLCGTEDIKEIASAANTSHFHFQRLFYVITDITVADYVRRRRLTLAAGEIQQGADILETALKFGYESQASFTRAFSRLHGLTPAKAREPGARLKAYPPLTFNISIQGVHSMEYQIKDFESFQITGAMRRITTEDGQNLRDIPAFFEEKDKDGTIGRLMKLNGKSDHFAGSLLGICADFEEEKEEFNFLIAVEPEKNADFKNLETRSIPAMTWAVFPGSGKMPDSIQQVWKRIFSEWFPSMDYEHAEGPELEVYLPDNGDPEDCPFEVWIPIRKK